MPERETIERARADQREGKARRAGVKLPPPRKGKTSVKTRRKAALDYSKGQRKPNRTPNRTPNPERSRATRQALEREGRQAASKQALSRQAKSAARRRS